MDNKNWNHISGSFNQINKRFEQVDQRFDRVESDIKDIKSDVQKIREVLLSRRAKCKVCPNFQIIPKRYDPRSGLRTCFSVLCKSKYHISLYKTRWTMIHRLYYV